MNKETTRIGLVGYGAWGRHHAKSISTIRDVELVAVASRSPESVALAEKEFPGISGSTDYRELVANPAVDVVDIVVPTHLHTEIAAAALETGKHVILEKPMAATVAECDRLIAAAKRSGSVLTIVHEMRVSPQWAAIKRIIDEGGIGRPQYAMLNLFRFPYRSGAGNWRYDRSTVGSWILEEPIHFYDLLLWYFEQNGAPESVNAHGTSRLDGRGMYENFSSVVRFRSGEFAVVAQSLGGFEHHQVVEVVGTAGSVRSLWSGAMDRTDKPVFSVLHQRGDDRTPVPVTVPTGSGEVLELQLFLEKSVAAIRSGAPYYAPETERRLIELCIAADESAAAGKEIRLPDYPS
ncbi:MAG TPA: Gfo/Idh/MocA family oxidoreductase [Spirochaetia bacterium]|nr:Gfo/Idh/MocA family oxidoreductase [Spirochaetia bacterium]